MKLFASLLLMLICISIATPARGGGHLHRHHKITCPQCHKICRATPEKIEIEKECFNVECKEICIPAITFPWQKCCGPPKCGKVISVKVLKKHEYTCPGCAYKWEIEDCPCGACNTCGPHPIAPPLAPALAPPVEDQIPIPPPPVR